MHRIGGACSYVVDLRRTIAKRADEMSLEHSPARDDGFWYRLIGEKKAAEFVDLTVRTMQALRQRGGGPVYVRISSRCVKYRRIDLRTWAERRLRSSTADPGPEEAAP